MNKSTVANAISIKRVLPIAIVIITWWIASRFSNSLFLPNPMKVGETFLELIQNGMLIDSLKASFLRITTATLLSVSIAVPIGLLVANYKIMDDMVTPITSFMRF